MESTRLHDDTSRRRDPAVDGKRTYRIFVVHHTHWDREWWSTFQDFRIRLVEIIDDLLATLDRDPTFKTFLLDSQTIVLQDYLEVRPEERARVIRYIREGRIQCGPWFVLSDEFLVSAESIVRNLLLARRVSRELGCPLQEIGYLPDTFGHIAQMPQILQGFGIDNAFVWRGRGGEPEAVKQEFLWEAPDGSRVLTHWFPDGYYQMPFLHFGKPERPYEDKLGRIHASIDRWASRATTDALLMPYGGDHRPFDRDIGTKIEDANRSIEGLGEIRWASPEEYVQAVREQNPALQIVRGELRAEGSSTPHLLPGVLSARLYLKRFNFEGQTWLERYAEPLSTAAWLHGRRYDRGLLWTAWELLLQNHPHDSICGCSIDQVHREMVPRFEQSRQIAEILTEKAVQHINARIDTSDLRSGERPLVVHNALVRERDGWAAVWIERDDVTPLSHALVDCEGHEVPFQVRAVEGVRPMTDRFLHTEVGFVAQGVPGIGYKTYRLRRRESPLDAKQHRFTAMGPVARGKGDRWVTDLAIGPCAIENRWLRVEVDDRDGTLRVTEKVSGHTFSGLNLFDDGGDAGDTYNYSAPLGDLLLSSKDARTHVSIAEAGYSRATLRVDLRWSLPESLTADRLSRSTTYVPTELTTLVSLTAGSRVVDIVTEWENRTRDHRLRALFPLGSDVSSSLSEGHFSLAKRFAPSESGRGWPETQVTTLPQNGWVAVENDGAGLVIANRGLPEYEVLRDGRGTVALTILRAVGWLSREDTLTRANGAGPTTPTPDAQCLGPNRVRYSLIPYAGDLLTSGARAAAEEYLVPLYGSATDAHAGGLSPAAGLLDVSGDEALTVSACKVAEVDDALILRFWNAGATVARARLRFRHRPVSARLVDLKEEPLALPQIDLAADRSMVVEAGPAEIISIAVYF